MNQPQSHKDKEKADKPAPPLRIVGIGASAGGLDALRELMGTLPESKHLTYVIAQHVSPTHVSMLLTLLSPVTDLQVEDVQNNTRPEAGKVYITPPNHDVTLENGLLKLTEPSANVGPKPSVNRFFTSLAEDQGDQSIGIILSGTGSDGSTGIRAIKAAGGITLAQDPDTIKYDGMPKSAIHTGSVDLILKASEMGPALVRLIASPRPMPAEFINDENGDKLSEISQLVRLHTSFKLSDYKSSTVKRRIARRMSILGMPSLSSYIEYLKNNKDETYELMRDVFIGVTSFFRDPAAFAALSLKLQDIVERADENKVIRCWVPGCSSGEEVYTIAMLMEEAINDSKKNSQQYIIFASDMDTSALDRARAATYPDCDLERIPEEYQKKYIEPVGDQFSISKSIRNRVVFTRQNIIEDPPFSRLDLISCRNLLIYLNPPVQKRVLEMFHYSLKARGTLLLGKSESVESHTSLFRPINKAERLFLREEATTSYPLPSSRAVNTMLDVDREQSNSPSMNLNADTISSFILEELADRYAPATLAINLSDEIVHFQGSLAPFLSFPRGRAQMYLFDLIDPLFRVDLRAAVYSCRRDLQQRTCSTQTMEIDGTKYNITPVVSCLDPNSKNVLMVSFQKKELLPSESPVEKDQDSHSSLVISELEQELMSTRAHLNVVVEELEASNEELQSLNEELQSANEELQSTNEELQTSNEELQSTNEELLTVNDELQLKSTQLEDTANDLTNVKESLNFPLMVVNSNLQISRVNRASQNIVSHFGRLEGSSLSSIQWRFEIPGLLSHCREVMKSREIYSTTLHCRSDSVYSLQVLPHIQETDDVNGVVLMFQNITEQFHAEEALKKSESRYRQVTESLPQLVWTCEADGPCDYLSQRWIQYTGIDEEQQLGYGWLEQLHPDDRDRVIDAWKETTVKGGDFSIEFRIRRYDGEYRWFKTQATALRDENNRIVKWFGSNTDIHDLKLVQQELEAVKAHTYNVLDVMPEAVLVVNDQGFINAVNKRTQELLGYTQDDLLNQPVEYLIPERFRKDHVNHRQTYKEDPTTRPMGAGMDLYALHKDGHEVSVEIALAPLQEGDVYHTVVSIADARKPNAESSK